MAEISIKYFDTHEFIKQSKALGASEELTEYQVKQFERAIESAVKVVKEDIQAKELATKQDIKEIEQKIKETELKLEQKIEQASNRLILWVIGILLASGLIQHFFK